MESHNQCVIRTAQAGITIRRKHIAYLRHRHRLLDLADTECGIASALPNRKARSVALQLIITADGAVHQQAGSLSSQRQFDGLFTCTAEQIRTIVEGDCDVSALAGAVGSPFLHTDEPDESIAPA
jgi:hypothetical protein